MQMQTQKKTVVTVTHDVEFVAECNPRVVLMKEGRIVADGVGKEILTRPSASGVVVDCAAADSAGLHEAGAVGFPRDVIEHLRSQSSSS